MGVPPSPRESPAHHRRPRNPQWVQGYPTGCASITLHRNVRGFFMQLLPFGNPGRLFHTPGVCKSTPSLKKTSPLRA
nr:MAG TPA: hypothetical protein [Caudoviricetes sp.]